MTNLRYFYTDPLAAAWMAKHFGMKLYCRHDAGEMAEYELSESEREYPFGSATIDDGCTAETWGAVIHESLGRRAYVHADSLGLLEPMAGDLVKIMGEVGYVPEGDGLAETYARRVAQNNCRPHATGRIIQRDGKPFH